MLAGALLFPVSVGILTYYDRQRDIFRPDYVSKDEPGVVVQAAEVVAKPSLGGPFTMRSAATGKLVTDKEVFAGRWTLLYFGYTKCAEICPTSLKFLVSVMDECEAKYGAAHPKNTEKLQTAFVTIDTIRDDRNSLQKFLERFRPKARGLVGLYGTDEQTMSICKAWRVYFTSMSETPEEVTAREARGFKTLRDAIAADDTYQLDHSAAAYLVGPDGKLRDFFFKEMGKDHAVERIGLHWDDAYGIDSTPGKRKVG